MPIKFQDHKKYLLINYGTTGIFNGQAIKFHNVAGKRWKAARPLSVNCAPQNGPFEVWKDHNFWGQPVPTSSWLLSVINWQFAFCQGSYRPSLARLFCLLLWTCLFLFPSPKPSVLVSFCFSFSFLLSPLIIQFVRFSGRLIRWGCICPKLPAICYDRRTFPFLGSIWYAANFSSCVAQCHFQFLAI